MDKNELSLHLYGICVEYDFRALVLTGPSAAEVARRSKWTIAAQGEVDLHLGAALFDRPFVYTPVSIITEGQQDIAGAAIFDWLVEGCYRMPRSEVFGIDVQGRQAQVFARDIDVEESPIAVFGHGTWVVGLVEIDPAVTQVQRVERPDFPARFRAALKAYRAGLNVKLEKMLE